MAANDGLSFTQVSSDNLWKTIEKCIKKKTVQKPTRKLVADCVNEYGVIEHKKLFLSKYANEYMVLSFDSSKFKGTDYFIGMGYITYKHCPPILICFEENVKNQEVIARIISDVIKEVSSKSETINIVVDGLRHQLQAVSLVTSSDKGNIHDYLKNFDSTVPFVLPDLPHLFQLSLTHTMANSELKLNQYVADVDNLANSIRTQTAVQFIGAKCPTYPKTRFFYVVLRMLFIVKKREKIQEYFKRFVLFNKITNKYLYSLIYTLRTSLNQY
jgi:hypothetical protein